MKKEVLVAGIVFALAFLMTVVAVAPAFAWNFNDVPEGAVRYYWTGGYGTVAIPADWPPAPGRHYDQLVIRAQHIEASTLGTGDNILLCVPYVTPTMSTLLPMACFSTNLDDATFCAMLRSGTPAAIPGNTRLVPESALSVKRHGNRITAELKTPQAVKWPKATADVVIPAFKMELDEVDGSLHWDREVYLGHTGGSLYTVYDDNMGFLGNGVFTCSAWSYMAYPMTDCSIIMHGINTNVPPSPP